MASPRGIGDRRGRLPSPQAERGHIPLRRRVCTRGPCCCRCPRRPPSGGGGKHEVLNHAAERRAPRGGRAKAAFHSTCLLLRTTESPFAGRLMLHIRTSRSCMKIKQSYVPFPCITVLPAVLRCVRRLYGHSMNTPNTHARGRLP
jgi:hypothetical protein